jgi:spermidine synthase
MKPREVLNRTTTPDGEPLELAREAGHYVIRVAGVPLMSSARTGSEQAMARVAAEELAASSSPKRAPRVLVGGLGMGFTVRAALDTFGDQATITVAELLPALVEYNRGVLGDLAGCPLADRRVHLFEGDVRAMLARGGWDAVLMDVDNGPDAFTASSNASLYGDVGAGLMARSLEPGGVLVVWSAYPDPGFERRLRRAGLRCEIQRVHARGDVKKGGRHILFVATRGGKKRS